VDDILLLEHQRIVIATGARWTRMLYSTLELPVKSLDGPYVFTPDDVAAGAHIEGPIAVFDFDNYYMGGVLAEHLARSAHNVTYITPSGYASAWTIMTNEQPQVHRALANAGIRLKTLSRVTGISGAAVTVANIFSGEVQQLPCKSLVIVGARTVRDELYHSLMLRQTDWQSAGISSVDRIGDSLAPGAIAHAVHSGHRFARELDQAAGSEIYRRDSPILESPPLLYKEGHSGARAR
jgi:dimethylamine/trimethylamine dehydrogenase